MLWFFSVASDGTTRERQISNSVFWSILYQFEDVLRRQLCIDLDAVFDIATRFAKLRSKFCKA